MRDAAIDLCDFDVRDIKGSPFVISAFGIDEDLVLDLEAPFKDVSFEFDWAAFVVVKC